MIGAPSVHSSSISHTHCVGPAASYRDYRNALDGVRYECGYRAGFHIARAELACIVFAEEEEHSFLANESVVVIPADNSV